MCLVRLSLVWYELRSSLIWVADLLPSNNVVGTDGDILVPKKTDVATLLFLMLQSQLTHCVSHSLSLCFVSHPLQNRSRERKLKLSPVLIKTSLGGNAWCIFWLENAASCLACSIPGLLAFSRRFPPCCWYDVFHRRGHLSLLPRFTNFCRRPSL